MRSRVLLTLALAPGLLAAWAVSTPAHHAPPAKVHVIAAIAASPATTAASCPTIVNGHPVNCNGYVTDGSPQLDDAHCSTPQGSGGPEPGQDECLAARHGGYVTDGDPQLDDAHCVGPPRGQVACVTARRHLPFSCVATIINHEDPGWNPTQYNTGGSGAYGLPQALPGSKMAQAGPDWRESAATQARWLLDDYVGQYGGVCAAASHDVRYGTY